MKTITVGFLREDGDIQALATLNNNDELVGECQFMHIAERVMQDLQAELGGEYNLKMFERQDAPDYITLEYCNSGV